MGTLGGVKWGPSICVSLFNLRGHFSSHHQCLQFGPINCKTRTLKCIKVFYAKKVDNSPVTRPGTF